MLHYGCTNELKASIFHLEYMVPEQWKHKSTECHRAGFLNYMRRIATWRNSGNEKYASNRLIAILGEGVQGEGVEKSCFRKDVEWWKIHWILGK